VKFETVLLLVVFQVGVLQPNGVGEKHLEGKSLILKPDLGVLLQAACVPHNMTRVSGSIRSSPEFEILACPISQVRSRSSDDTSMSSRLSFSRPLASGSRSHFGLKDETTQGRVDIDDQCICECEIHY
jgi:hypothetical protein